MPFRHKPNDTINEILRQPFSNHICDASRHLSMLHEVLFTTVMTFTGINKTSGFYVPDALQE